MRKFFSGIEPCLIGMEACASSHYWARELKAMGHDVRLIAPIYVKPYVKRGKNDAADAAAICEAMSRPAMRFVPVKSAENQAVLTLHKTRELLIKQRTMSVNALRGHLSEFGLIVAKGIGRVDALLALAEVDATLPSAARRAAKVLAEQIGGLDKSLHDLEAEMPRPMRQARRAACSLKFRASATLRNRLPRLLRSSQQQSSRICRTRACSNGAAIFPLGLARAAAELKRRQTVSRSHHQKG
jgi:transposase